jgi:methionyl-tRNA formyltransferase
MSSSRKIILLGREDSTTAILYNSLRSEFPIAGILVERGESRMEFVKRRMKRLGIPKTLGQIAFRVLMMPLLKALSRRRVREIVRASSLDTSPVPHDRLTRVRSVNADETIEVLQGLKPKVVVVSGTRIISARVLNCTPAVFLNMHAGITPMYRGAHGGYWALVQNDPNACGVTVHEVDTGIDTGRILGQARIQPNGVDNFATYGLLQIAAGLPLLKKAIHDALDDRPHPAPVPTGVSHLWSHPTLAEYLRNRFKAGVK